MDISNGKSCTYNILIIDSLNNKFKKETKLIKLNIQNNIKKIKSYHFADFYGKITELKLKGVKIILGVGGIENSIDEKWSEMAASQDKRKIFESSLLKFLQKWNFDGVQIAWQYPVCKEVKYFYFDKLTILTTDLIINTLHNVVTYFF